MHISKYAHSTRVRIHHLFYAIDDNTMDTKMTTRVVHSMMTLVLEKYELVIINMTTRIRLVLYSTRKYYYYIMHTLERTAYVQYTS